MSFEDQILNYLRSMKGSYDVKGDFTGFGRRDLQSIIAVYKDSQVGVGNMQAMGLDILRYILDVQIERLY